MRTYSQVIASLREAYDRQVEERDKREISPWKLEERRRFLALLQEEGKQSLLEIGAGTGACSKFFQEGGLEVIATDLSSENVKRCRKKVSRHTRWTFFTSIFRLVPSTPSTP